MLDCLNRLIESLPSGARVLDLGARSGSFSTARADLVIVRADLEPPDARKSGSYVAADAAHLPFAARSFDAVIANHSLEHFIELERAVSEIGRVVQAEGAMFVAVPDAGTLCDRIYRWIGRGGGHVNPFRSEGEVVALIERLTPLRHRATVLLGSSLSFLNRHNFTHRPPRRIALFGWGSETFLAVLTAAFRRIDRVLGTRLSIYGWAFYFGAVAADSVEGPWEHVCVRCGSSMPEDALPQRGWSWRCRLCGGFNLL